MCITRFSLSVVALTGEFLVNNYKQALSILQGKAALWKTMEDQGIEGHQVFNQ